MLLPDARRLREPQQCFTVILYHVAIRNSTYSCYKVKQVGAENSESIENRGSSFQKAKIEEVSKLRVYMHRASSII